MASEPTWKPNSGDWYIPIRGKVAHRLRGYVGGRIICPSPWCANPHEGVARRATDTDPRCKRCEERARG